MSCPPLRFGEHGPFDDEEQTLVVEIVEAVRRVGSPETDRLVATVQHHLDQIHSLGAVLSRYPSLLVEQALGRQLRSLDTLVELLSHSNLSNFDMFLPTRALLSRTLAMAEVNFYRLLRYVCTEALEPQHAQQQRARIDPVLCECLYARLIDEVLRHIASDEHVDAAVRKKAILALSQIWENPAYRVKDFFPLLEATWEARRRVPVTLGTLMGTSEMFRLLAAGCDSRFVDYLVRPGHSEDETSAFREFLFGSTTEKLHRLEQLMAEQGKSVVGRSDLVGDEAGPDPGSAATEEDPAIVLYEFFLSRHLQAAARRLADLPGPKRTAEEYVMLRYLEQWTPDAEAPANAPRP